jgi:long-chain acyl-CoA synthetase
MCCTGAFLQKPLPNHFPVRILFRAMKALARRLQQPALRRRLFAKVHKNIGPDLQMLASGGSHFDAGVANDLNDLGYTVLQAYGLTETSAAATVTPMEKNRIGTVGRPIRGVTVRIDAPSEKGIGEVLIRGPVVMKGYYRAAEQTAQVLKEGWFYTGDLGQIDSEGHLSITGRSKDVIVLANGENVYPEELETHYSKSPFIKDICILGISEDGGGHGGILHAIVVPDMDEFRRRGQTAIMEMIRFDIENLSKQVPSYYRIHSLAVRNEPLPRTVTRKLKRFEIQQEEAERKKAKELEKQGATPRPDHPVFRSGAGAVIAELVRDVKSDTGALDPSMNIELDLGFDSLGRVELLGMAEARLGTHIDEHQATRIFTLGELIDAFEAASSSENVVGTSWKQIMETAAADRNTERHVFGKRPLLNPLSLVAMRFSPIGGAFVLSLALGRPGKNTSRQALPALSQSRILSRRTFAHLASSETGDLQPVYFGIQRLLEGALSRRFAEICKIVSIDPNVNLIRAMQAGAVGLKRERVLLIFPEGTRTIDGHVAEFKKGAAILAYELGVPIVPVGIRGAFETWPRGGGFRFHPIEFHFGDLIDPKAFSGESDPYQAITEKLENDVKALSGDEVSEIVPG